MRKKRQVSGPSDQVGTSSYMAYAMWSSNMAKKVVIDPIVGEYSGLCSFHVPCSFPGGGGGGT